MRIPCAEGCGESVDVPPEALLKPTPVRCKECRQKFAREKGLYDRPRERHDLDRMMRRKPR